MKFYLGDKITIENLIEYDTVRFYIKANIVSIDGLSSYEDAVKIARKLAGKEFEVKDD